MQSDQGHVREVRDGVRDSEEVCRAAGLFPNFDVGPQRNALSSGCPSEVQAGVRGVGQGGRMVTRSDQETS